LDSKGGHTHDAASVIYGSGQSTGSQQDSTPSSPERSVAEVLYPSRKQEEPKAPAGASDAEVVYPEQSKAQGEGVVNAGGYQLEGIDPASALGDQFIKTAQLANLNRDQAQKLIDMHRDYESKAEEAHQKQLQQWQQEVLSDHELFSAVEPAKALLREYDQDRSLRELLNSTGAGNNPAVIRFIGKIARQLGY
jgi:hypothetical protein